METVSTSSTSAASSSSSTNIPFTGVSQYASDYQAELNKAVEVAQIPVTQLQSQDSVVLAKETALGTLQTDVSSLATSLNNIATLAGNQALGASSSNSSVVSVTDSGATSPATYTINSVTSTATTASEVSTQSYADGNTTAVSSTGEMQLVVGSQTYSLNLSGDNNLNGLVSEINALGAGVTASVLTTSTGNFLSISADQTGATTLKLMDDPTGADTNILTSNNQGTNAVFQLDGITVSQSQNTINNVIPGMTFTIQAPSSTPVTLSLATDPTQLSSDLQDFVTQYNNLASYITSQTGTSGGALVGDTAINQLQNMLREMTSYTTTGGTIQSLADLGIEFSETGQASFDSTTFDSLSSDQISDAFQYLGSATSGLGAFGTQLSQLSDPVSGVIQMETSGLQQTDQQLQSQMSTLNDQISTMQTNLTQQLEAADAQQAELQTQQQELTASLQGLNLVLYGKDTTSF